MARLPFSASVEKKGQGLKTLARFVQRLDGYKVDVGIFDKVNASKAAIHEFGVQKSEKRGEIPARPFMNGAIEKAASRSSRIMAGRLARAAGSPEEAMYQVAEVVKDQVQQNILDVTTPALKESTVKRKGFRKPLIEYGDMYNAVKVRTNAKGGK